MFQASFFAHYCEIGSNGSTIPWPRRSDSFQAVNCVTWERVGVNFGNLILAEVQSPEALGHDLEGRVGDVTEGIGVEGQVLKARAAVGKQVSAEKRKGFSQQMTDMILIWNNDLDLWSNLFLFKMSLSYSLERNLSPHE